MVIDSKKKIYKNILHPEELEPITIFDKTEIYFKEP